MAVERSTVELGVLIYQGAQLAAVHGLTDLFGVANRIAAEHQSVQLPLLRVSHWQVDAHGIPARVFDSHPGADQPMMAVLVPPSIGEFGEEQAPPALLEWIRQQHAAGTVLGGVCIGSIMLARSGLLDGRSATGLKPTEYCQHLRVGKARQMLEFTNGTIDHIAWTVGYQDPSAFRATFKKITGLAPSDYRSRFGV